jgi:hypothetical protein
VRAAAPALIDRNKKGCVCRSGGLADGSVFGVFFKAARIGACFCG